MPTSTGSQKKKEEKTKERQFQKIIHLCFIDYDKALTVWITTNYAKFLKTQE